MRRLLRWLLPSVLTLALGAGIVRAQAAPSPGSRDIPRGYQAIQNAGDEGASRTPALQYTVAGIITLAVLVILCMPARKLPAGVGRED